MQIMQLKKQPEGNNADALKQRLVAMQRFYFKGIMGIDGAQGVLHAVGFYQDTKEGAMPFGKDEKFWAEEAHKRFYHLKEIYSSIPFDQLRCNADYYPLFAASNALKMAESKLNEALAENAPERFEARNSALENIFHFFSDWGSVYKFRINALREKIQKIEGNSDFDPELIDINGKNWGKMSGV